jgi:hypothetical protein
MSNVLASTGLLVSIGGVNAPAQKELDHRFFKLRLSQTVSGVSCKPKFQRCMIGGTLMKIFLSYATEDKGIAEPIAFSLRARDHKVFLGPSSGWRVRYADRESGRPIRSLHFSYQSSIGCQVPPQSRRYRCAL